MLIWKNDHGLKVSSEESLWLLDTMKQLNQEMKIYFDLIEM